jgi:MEMO1 family protein
MSGEVVFVGIAPHPPLLVPAVGKEKVAQVQDSVNALNTFASQLIKTNPDTVVIISPHSPTSAKEFGAFSNKILIGDFRQFANKQVSLSFPNDLELLKELANTTKENKIPFSPFPNEYLLDHGVLVPMYYLHQAGWQGQVLALSFSTLSIESHIRFGETCHQAAKKLGRKIAFVASADLSHYLSLNGPYHFEPVAHLFDKQICEAIEQGNLSSIINVDQSLRYKAGECGYRSILVAIGVAGKENLSTKLLSYECPFGVGYMTAILKEINI